ncbi:hypothetical protein N7468_001998 [Penicillium chermesinum]|uniref:Uncharacterized protein n=1 Tax=Penicillium chermesinum TaxID=63820 RepID=A0A9W9TX69_9EURO|nr:uncharacterized protein N7468_001998 [Penicillium chermesinum]KAJ5247015.1 hypothetical protein N7468_001998 [Penicillium chermesinum]
MHLRIYGHEELGELGRLHYSLCAAYGAAGEGQPFLGGVPGDDQSPHRLLEAPTYLSHPLTHYISTLCPLQEEGT